VKFAVLSNPTTVLNERMLNFWGQTGRQTDRQRERDRQTDRDIDIPKKRETYQ